MTKTLRSIFLAQVLSSFVCAFGQAPDKVSERDLWRTRADLLTDALLKDSSKRDTLDHAVIIAKLGDLWWETDQSRANAWLEKSVDAICFYSPDKSKGENEKFFRAARQILSLVSNHNKKQANRLSQVLSQSESATENDRKQNAQTLIEEALRIVKDDPRSATALGMQALNLGFPANADRLSWALRRYSPEFANQFFRAALSDLAASPDRSKLYVMEAIAFPENLSADFPANLRPPADLRLSFLSFLADYLTQLQLRFTSGEVSTCAGEAVFTLRLEKAFTEMLPKRADAVRQVINICIGKQSQQVRDLVTKTDASNDVDELLKRADELRDSGLRASYLFKAALAANQQKNFAKSIEILEKMNDDERKSNPDFWQELRWEAGANLAVARFKEGDFAGANQILKEIPDPLRPHGQITFALQFSPNDLTSYQVCVDLLNDARRGIVKSDLPFARKSNYWLNLIKLFSNYKMSREATETLREVVTGFNSSRSDVNDAPQNTAMANRLIADSKRILPGFSLSLLETDESSVVESISLLKDENARTEINFQFLEVMLKKCETLRLELDKMEKAGAGKLKNPGQ